MINLITNLLINHVPKGADNNSIEKLALRPIVGYSNKTLFKYRHYETKNALNSLH